MNNFLDTSEYISAYDRFKAWNMEKIAIFDKENAVSHGRSHLTKINSEIIAYRCFFKSSLFHNFVLKCFSATSLNVFSPSSYPVRNHFLVMRPLVLPLVQIEF